MAERRLVSRKFPKGIDGLMTRRIDVLQDRKVREERHYFRPGGVAFYYFDRKSGRSLTGEEVREKYRRSR